MNEYTPLPGREVRGSTSGRPVMALLDLLGRRWALRIIWELREGASPTFRELQQRCGGISSSVLAQRLRELGEADLVIARTAVEESGRRDGHGYRLSEQGRALLEAVLPLEEFSRRWRPRRHD